MAEGPNYGTPTNLTPPAPKRVVMRSVALGFTTAAEVPQLPPGMSSRMSNFIAQEGGLTPRPGLLLGMNSNSTLSLRVLFGAGWVGDYYTTTNVRRPVALTYPPAIWGVTMNGSGVSSWSTLSQTGPAGLSSNTMSATTSVWDAVVYYHPTTNQNELCFTSYDPTHYRPYSTAPGFDPYSTGAYLLFSTLTNAPAARFVTVFDNRLVFGNTSDWSSPFNDYAQRVVWSGRGLPETYSEPQGGAEDLLGAEGSITRLVADSDRLLVFFEREIWYGVKAPFPFDIEFSPLDKTIGTSAPWSVAKAPGGFYFLGSDFNTYFIPTGGAPQAIGAGAGKMVRENIAKSNYTQANGVYSEHLGGYLLTFRTVAGGEQGVLLSTRAPEPTWCPMGFDMPSGWKILRTGVTSVQSLQHSTAAGEQRVLFTDYGPQKANVLELTSLATTDNGSRITASYLAVIPNPDPSMRQFVRSLRLDYRADSASSLSVRMTPDFGTTYPVSVDVALPPAPLSAQTVIPVQMGAVYPAVELRHTSGHSFAIQGLTAVVQDQRDV